MCIGALNVVGELLNETLTTLGVGVATIHEAVDVGLLDVIFLGDVCQLEQVVERRVYAAI